MLPLSSVVLTVSECGTVTSDIKLEGDVVSNHSVYCFEVKSDAVEIDCASHSIVGVSTPLDSVAIFSQNHNWTTILNCTVSGFGKAV